MSNSSNRHPNQILMEPITRVERSGTGVSSPRPAPPNRSRRGRSIVIAGFLIVTAVVIYLNLSSGKKQASRDAIPPLPINTVTVSTGDIGEYVSALGTVTPFNTVSLTARVAGQIAKVEYEEGQLVHVGDPLWKSIPPPSRPP